MGKGKKWNLKKRSKDSQRIKFTKKMFEQKTDTVFSTGIDKITAISHGRQNSNSFRIFFFCDQLPKSHGRTAIFLSRLHWIHRRLQYHDKSSFQCEYFNLKNEYLIQLDWIFRENLMLPAKKLCENHRQSRLLSRKF